MVVSHANLTPLSTPGCVPRCHTPKNQTPRACWRGAGAWRAGRPCGAVISRNATHALRGSCSSTSTCSYEYADGDKRCSTCGGPTPLFQVLKVAAATVGRLKEGSYVGIPSATFASAAFVPENAMTTNRRYIAAVALRLQPLAAFVRPPHRICVQVLCTEHAECAAPAPAPVSFVGRLNSSACAMATTSSSDGAETWRAASSL